MMHAHLNGMNGLVPGVARNLHRVSSSIADVLPATIISRLNRLPGADIMLLGPRTSRVVIDVQHPDRPPGARVEAVTLRTVAEALVDELALGFMKGNQAADARSHFEDAHLHAERIAASIEAGRLDATPGSFCPEPDAPRAVARPGTVRALGAEATHLTFPSGFEAPEILPGADSWGQFRANLSVHLFLLEHDPDAPWLVNVHGFKQGLPTDLFLFRSAATRERFGVNVVHPVLPMSGLRSSKHSPPIPGTDLATNVIGLAQAVWDVRRTIRWIRQRSDAPIILHGVSLGSYVVSLVAGLDDDVTAVIAGLPVVDYPALMRRHAERMELPASDLALVNDPTIDVLYSPVSPLRADPKVRHDRRYIYAGKVDQVSSAHQALALWDHWGESSIHWFEGGHLGGVLWDRGVKRYIDEAIGETLQRDPVPA